MCSSDLATLADRSGNHGEILACLLGPDGTILSFAMSCRVFQRRVEYAFLAWLATQPAPPVAMRWTKTARNEPFLQFLGDIAGQVEGDALIRLDPADITGRYARDLELFTLCHA